jgi:hypothetical protein
LCHLYDPRAGRPPWRDGPPLAASGEADGSARRLPSGAARRFKAHLIGFRGFGNPMGNPFRGPKPVTPAVVLRLADGRKRCFVRGSFTDADERFIVELYVKEMSRLRRQHHPPRARRGRRGRHGRVPGLLRRRDPRRLAGEVRLIVASPNDIKLSRTSQPTQANARPFVGFLAGDALEAGAQTSCSLPRKPSRAQAIAGSVDIH